MDPIADFIERYLSPGSVAFDIGANRGDYARAMLAKAGSVYAFEPNPEMATVLRSSIEDARMQVIRSAVGDQTGPVEFHIDRRAGLDAMASSVHRLDGMGGMTETVTVECTTLDGFCAARRIAPSFIKIDTEGNEGAVFAGAQRTIRRHRPFIVFEFWESWWRRGVSDIFKMLAPRYDLIVLGTGEDAAALYAEHGDDGTQTGSVDIGCIPKARRWFGF